MDDDYLTWKGVAIAVSLMVMWTVQMATDSHSTSCKDTNHRIEKSNANIH